MVKPRDIAGNAEEGRRMVNPRNIVGNAEKEDEPRDIAGRQKKKKNGEPQKYSRDRRKRRR